MERMMVVKVGRKMPSQKPHLSNQEYCTPRDFLNACEARFGKFSVDLAAKTRHAVCPVHITPEMDSLETDWAPLIGDGIGWLNPPFGGIKKFAERCAFYGERGFKILFLTPYTLAGWQRKIVAPNARTIGIGRLMFVERLPDGSERPACYDKHGNPTNYVKDLQIAAFGFRHANGKPVRGGEFWEWKKPWGT